MVWNNPQAKTRKHHHTYEAILVVPIYEPIFSHCHSIARIPEPNISPFWKCEGFGD